MNLSVNTEAQEWVESLDPKKGHTFFYNRQTRKAQWSKPQGDNVKLVASNDVLASGLGDVDLWREEWSEAHKRNYYYNIETRQTSWIKPIMSHPYRVVDIDSKRVTNSPITVNKAIPSTISFTESVNKATEVRMSLAPKREKTEVFISQRSLLDIEVKILQSFKEFLVGEKSSQKQIQMLTDTANRLVKSLTNFEKKTTTQNIVAEFDVKLVSFIKSTKCKLQIDSLAKCVYIVKEGGKPVKTLRLIRDVAEIIPTRQGTKVQIIKITAKANGVTVKKEKIYSFNSIEERSDFCLMTALLAPQTISKIIAPNHSFDEIKAFDVTMIHDTGKKRRQLVINMDQGTVGRRFDEKDTDIKKVVKVTSDVVCHCSYEDSKHLKVFFGVETTPSYDLLFDSMYDREKFAGCIRALAWGLKDSQFTDGNDRGESLSIFMGTFNTSDQEPGSKHRSTINQWVPRDHHDIYAFTFEETNKIEEWVKIIHKHLGLQVPLASFRGSVQCAVGDALECSHCHLPIINQAVNKMSKFEDEKAKIASTVSSGQTYLINPPDNMRTCACCGVVCCVGCCHQEVFELNKKIRMYVCSKCYDSSTNIIFSGQFLGNFEEVEYVNSSSCSRCTKDINISEKIFNCPCCGKCVCNACKSTKKVLNLKTLTMVEVCTSCIENNKRITKQTRDVSDFETRHNFIDESFKICSTCNAPLKDDFIKGCDACFLPKCSKCCNNVVFNLRINARKNVCNTCHVKVKQYDISGVSSNFRTGSKLLLERMSTVNVPPDELKEDVKERDITSKKDLNPLLEDDDDDERDEEDEEEKEKEKEDKEVVTSHWTDTISEVDMTFNYQILNITTMWGIHVVIFARNELIPHISRITSSSVKCGIAGIMGNKGGVGCGFVYREHTSLAFVGSHLTAGAPASKLERRNENYKTIVGSLNLGQPYPSMDFTSTYHHVFWAGDFNYRIDRGHIGTLEEFNEVQALIETQNFAELNHTDQFRLERREGRAFGDFQEGEIKFAPTYRTLKNISGYSNKNNQNPSYCDRVVWRSLPGYLNDCNLIEYDGRQSVNTGDHRPVIAVYNLDTRLPYIYFKDNEMSKFKMLFSGVRFEAEQHGVKGEWEIQVSKLRQVLIANNCELAFHLCNLVGGTNPDELSKNIVGALGTDYTFFLICKFIENDASENLSAEDFLEKKSLLMSLISVFIKETCREWLKTTFNQVIQDICNLTYVLEVKSEGSADPVVEEQTERVLLEVDKIISMLIRTVPDCPKKVRSILQRLANHCDKMWPTGPTGASSPRNGPKRRSSVTKALSNKRIVVAIVFFKGLISNAIASPTVYGIMIGIPRAFVRKSLALLKEIISRIGLRQFFLLGRLVCMNPFIASSDAPVKFIQDDLFNGIPEDLMHPTSKAEFFIPKNSLDVIDSDSDAAIRVLYNHIRRSMSAFSELTVLQKSVIGGTVTTWECLTNLIEPPRSEKSKKKKDAGLKSPAEKNENKISGQLQINIYSPYLEKFVSSNFANPLDAFSRFHSALVGGTVANAAWEWDDTSYSNGNIVISDLNWLTNQHVFIEIKSNSSVVFGQCQIWLRNAHISHHIEPTTPDATELQLPAVVGGDGKFSVPVYHHGVSVGILRGMVSIHPQEYCRSPKKSDADLVSSKRSTNGDVETPKLAKMMNNDVVGYIGNTSCSQCKQIIKEAHELNQHKAFNRKEEAPCETCVICIDGVDLNLCKNCYLNKEKGVSKKAVY